MTVYYCQNNHRVQIWTCLCQKVQDFWPITSVCFFHTQLHSDWSFSIENAKTIFFFFLNWQLFLIFHRPLSGLTNRRPHLRLHLKYYWTKQHVNGSILIIISRLTSPRQVNQLPGSVKLIAESCEITVDQINCFLHLAVLMFCMLQASCFVSWQLLWFLSTLVCPRSHKLPLNKFCTWAK